ncbi:MAG TPA: hypothetical protein VF297_06850 [Pyrinomonadaceae bacterium]
MPDRYDSTSFLRDVIPVVIAAATVLVGALANNLNLSLTFQSLGFVLSIGLLSALVSVVLTRRITSSTYQTVIKEFAAEVDELDVKTSDELKQLRNCIVSLRHLLSQDKILTDEYIAQLEANIPECSEVWIVTPNLHKDIPTAGAYCFDDVVKDNINKKNVYYTYLIPNESIMRQKALRFRNSFPEEYQDRIKIIPLNPDQWERLPYRGSDLAIYNPLQTDNKPTAVVFELPTGKRDQWIQADETLTGIWSREISNIIEEQITRRALLPPQSAALIDAEVSLGREKEKKVARTEERTKT